MAGLPSGYLLVASFHAPRADAAWWAVDSWALALGVIASARQQSRAVDRKSSNESKRGFNKKRETATERISSDTDTSTAVLDIRGDKEVDAPLQKQFLTQLDQDLDNRLNGWHAGQKNSKTNLAWTWDRFPDPRRADKYLRLRVGHDNPHGLFVGVYVGPVLAKGIQGST